MNQLSAQQIQDIVGVDALKAFLNQNLLNVDFLATICSIDVGYGFTKSMKFENGKPVFHAMPSQAALSSTNEINSGFFVKTDTKKIEYGGTMWEVGPDVLEIASKSEVRALHENFVETEQWMVLFLGALEYLGVEEIDMLVLGLPVNNMSKEDEMRKKAIGTHKVNGNTYTVKDVMVVPQPLGALYNHAVTSNNFELFMNTNTLVIDPGYLTFDFLVSKGFKVDAHRSGARAGGMSAVLNAIAKSISKEIDEEYDDANEIDAVLDIKNYSGPTNEKKLYVYGTEINIPKHIVNTKPVIDASMNFMKNKVGNSRDITNIIMGGGPSAIFHRSIAKIYPKHNVIVLDNGIFVNVYGFSICAMMAYFGKVMNKKAA